MPAVPSDTITGTLVVTDLPDKFCFESARQLIETLPTLLGVEIPAQQLTNVVVSNVQPNSSQTTSIWFRVNNAGAFIGIYVFSNGEWIPIYPINTSNNVQVQYFTSFDGNPPAGWTKIDGSTTGLPTGVAAQLAMDIVTDGSTDVAFWAYFTG